ncbi:MAG TPA: zinc ribbon domain-containing protein [Gemmatimonadales bacterium]|nr:zinc ribbon domain-containing protein [Gemmatimonadales bacterium]
MAWEAVAAALVGLLVLWIVLRPLLQPESVRPPVYEPPEPTETRRGVALAALKEIEFDRAVGKLSEADYAQLKARYTAEALAALRAEEGEPRPAADVPADAELEALIAARVRAREAGGAGLVCRAHGPRPEPDAVFCSACGRRLEPACATCGSALPADGRFCERCGTKVAA